MCFWLHGEKVLQNNTRRIWENGGSTGRKKKLDVFQPNISDAIEFLVSLYRLCLGYSALNTARSALSSILVLGNGKKFGGHPLVSRFMKGIFELRPALPKYSEIRGC